MKKETAINEIRFIKSDDEKEQKRNRVEKFKSLLVNEIEYRINRWPPKDETGWNNMFKALKKWFMDVREGVDDIKFECAAFDQTYYIIRQKIEKEMEKAI
jgi:hypothetical protein